MNRLQGLLTVLPKQMPKQVSKQIPKWVLTLALMTTANADPSPTCPAGITDRSAVIASLHTLGNQLAMGRICALQETALAQLKQQTISRYAGCLVNFQIRGTEIQDALEAARPEAHQQWKRAADKPRLCEQVRLATQ